MWSKRVRALERRVREVRFVVWFPFAFVLGLFFLGPNLADLLVGDHSYDLVKFPLTPTPHRLAFVPCTGNRYVVRAEVALAKGAFRKRLTWGDVPFNWPSLESTSSTPTTRNSARTNSRMMQHRGTLQRGWVRQRLQHPFLTLHQWFMQLITDDPHWPRLDIMGPVALACPDMRVLGRGDEEKRICWDEEFEVTSTRPCVIYSVGSNNLWTFEEAVVAETGCVVHTFDCTVLDPRPPPSIGTRGTFHPLCLGGVKDDPRPGFVDYASMIAAAGGQYPRYFKIDIEGFEFESLTAFLEQARTLYQTTGIDHFPEQIAVEIHYQNEFFDMSDEGLLGFSNFLFRVGGYVIAHRRDQKYGYCATELLLVRISCNVKGDEGKM